MRKFKDILGLEEKIRETLDYKFGMIKSYSIRFQFNEMYKRKHNEEMPLTDEARNMKFNTYEKYLGRYYLK